MSAVMPYRAEARRGSIHGVISSPDFFKANRGKIFLPFAIEVRLDFP
jgi:hypothetical protein